MFILLLLSVAWYIILKNSFRREAHDIKRREQVLSAIKPDKNCEIKAVLCPSELPNTDEDVAGALIYIKATDFAGRLLERLYEQAGI